MLSKHITALLEETIATGKELGCQCAIWIDGEVLVNFAGGWSEAQHLRPVTENSLFPIFSTGKLVTATTALRAVAAGFIDLMEPVSRHWKEFVGEGRETIALSHVLSHTTGLYCLPHASSPVELTDWKLMTSRLATMRPAWHPGTRTKYQALTNSWLLGEPLMRATGCTLAALMKSLVLEPAGMLGNFYSGLPENEEYRLVRLERAADLQPPLPAKQTFWNPTENMLRSPLVRRATIPAFNSVATAKGLMRLGVSLLTGLLSAEMLQMATTLQRHPNATIPDHPDYWEIFGFGFQLFGPAHHRGAAFGHGGYGGSELYIHPASRTVVAFTRNRLSDNKQLLRQIKTTLNILE